MKAFLQMIYKTLEKRNFLFVIFKVQQMNQLYTVVIFIVILKCN